MLMSLDVALKDNKHNDGHVRRMNKNIKSKNMTKYDKTNVLASEYVMIHMGKIT